MSIDPPIQVRTSDRFEREIRQLAKRYRRIRIDIQPIIDQLESGELLGDQIPGMNYTLFKVRVKNSDVQKGKSGGYRIIYYLKTEAQILLVTLYSKSDKPDITADEVREIITRAETQFNISQEISE
ncbi:MAG: type II toxin-antitoxin system RelE/ParE family toxin [Phormidium tanganyikae FI6-MK23]|jgi:mRNA-degrading endonuclease RelE of RelBE toxin-antitoxin system|nr:type II toxin-antitoxin system RelE/ParE family toxin [Phormidium tanganyikae FI6-MK23]